jgi:dTDP-L-rhamnose 4-epimerase
MALWSDRAKDVALNVGTGQRIAVDEVAHSLRRRLGGPAPQILAQFREGDIRHCFADISAARKVLGWHPEVSFEQGLEDLVAWAREQALETEGLQLAVEELVSRGLVSSSP